MEATKTLTRCPICEEIREADGRFLCESCERECDREEERYWSQLEDRVSAHEKALDDAGVQ